MGITLYQHVMSTLHVDEIYNSQIVLTEMQQVFIKTCRTGPVIVLVTISSIIKFTVNMQKGDGGKQH